MAASNLDRLQGQDSLARGGLSVNKSFNFEKGKTLLSLTSIPVSFSNLVPEILKSISNRMIYADTRFLLDYRQNIIRYLLRLTLIRKKPMKRPAGNRPVRLRDLINWKRGSESV